MLEYDTSKWDDLDTTAIDFQDHAYTRLMAVFRYDPLCSFFQEHVLGSVALLLVKELAGKEYNEGQGYWAAHVEVSGSPLGAFGDALARRFASLTQKAIWAKTITEWKEAQTK